MKTNLLFLLLLVSVSGFAQLPLVRSGRNGVFVQFTKDLHGVRYRLERMETTAHTWQPVVVTESAPDGPSDLRARMLRLSAKNPIYEIPDDSLLTRLWVRYQQGSTTDSLGAYGQHPLLLEALGLGYFDADVQQNARYDYRATALLAAGDRVLQTTKTVGFPGSPATFGAKLIRATGTGNDVRLQFLITRPGPTLGMVVVKRGIFAQTDMKTIPANWGFRQGQKDSLIVEVTDNDVQKRMIYQYVLVPTDLLGNEGISSDTVTVTNLQPYVDLPTILGVTGRSDETHHAVRLSWKLSGGLRGLRSVDILRSDEYEGPYTQIASLSPTDTVFYDSRVRPVELHYYQLILNGNYDKSPASVRVAGMLNASEEAFLVPMNLKIERTAESIKLSWRRNDPNARGYIVYRGSTVQGDLQPVTDVIVSADTLVTYTQKIDILPPSPMYVFAVASENTSYNISPLSDKVYTGAIVPSNMATPLEVRSLSRKGTGGKVNALITWHDTRLVDRYVEGFAVYRKSESEKDYKLIYRQPDTTFIYNTFSDTTVKAGVHYSYQVQAYGLGQVVSAMSAESDFFEPLPPMLTPLGVRVFALANNGGVRVNWDAPAQPGIDKYRLYRYRTTGKPVLVASLRADVTQFTDKNADPGGTYFYQVATMSATGQESPLSDPIGIDW